jgi:hypothetical protein
VQRAKCEVGRTRDADRVVGVERAYLHLRKHAGELLDQGSSSGVSRVFTLAVGQLIQKSE